MEVKACDNGLDNVCSVSSANCLWFPPLTGFH